ncbi:MAG: hypothetical protein HC895_21245 [Leptolyngbyaceae cyanobacterium SM1_3_5]|nr:hypothetical protein [Leptolyngbyaceae cyanobacterium SM1_3_5]
MGLGLLIACILSGLERLNRGQGEAKVLIVRKTLCHLRIGMVRFKLPKDFDLLRSIAV